MPARLKRPCARIGCNQLVTPPERFCEVHKANAQASAQAHDKERGTASERGYDVTWQRERLAYLREHPVAECERCMELDLAGQCEGVLLPSKDVHHIDGDRRNREWTNLIAMGHACHSRITARQHPRG